MTDPSAESVASARGASARLVRRQTIGITITVLLVLVGIAVSLPVGAVETPLRAVLDTFTGGGDEMTRLIVFEARLPRALCAAIAGCNLAIAGVLLQSVTRNPLADPGIIGVTAGAGVAATVVLAAFPGAAQSLPAAAFVGAMVSAVFVYAVSWRPGGGVSPVRMILAGVAVNAILGAVIGLLITAFADRIPAVMFWTTGSFNGRNTDHLWLLLPYTAAGLAIAFTIRRPMRVLELGDDAAATMGVRVELTRLLAFAAAALLAGSAASVAGLIGFVGLVIPHLVRLLLGSNRLVIPVAAAAGAAMLVWSDLLARTVLGGSELPVGVVTGIVGGPYFIFLLYRSGWLR
ncbi:MAG: iron ABC transporter permease [Planctomycetota bacterium]